MRKTNDELREFLTLSHKYELVLSGLFNELQTQREVVADLTKSVAAQRDTTMSLETKLSDLTTNVAQLRQRGQLLRVSLVVSVAALAVSVAALFSAFS